MTDCSGLAWSSSILRSIFWPRSPPFSLSSSTAKITPRVACPPTVATGPVCGMITAIGMVCAEAGIAVAPSARAAAAIPLNSIDMVFLPVWPASGSLF
jgi:hypothetical protein